jgi:hypothetical protein
VFGAAEGVVHACYDEVQAIALASREAGDFMQPPGNWLWGFTCSNNCWSSSAACCKSGSIFALSRGWISTNVQKNVAPLTTVTTLTAIAMT